MVAAKKYFERRSLANALGTSLNTTGWTIGQVQEGFQSEFPIQPPLVALRFLPSKYIELQLGRSITTDKIFERRIQIDCYMETEPRAMSITDDIAEFLDALFISITDPSGAILGHLYVPDSETIVTDTLSPRISEPISLRWRGIVQATLQAEYLT
jgi:hypothetical protein